MKTKKKKKPQNNELEKYRHCWISVAAMQGILAGMNKPEVRFEANSVAIAAIEYADALIEELSK